MERINEFNKYLESRKKDTRIPIYKGCINGQCFCTGACKEIIGYKEVETKGGFFDLDQRAKCQHPEHNVPSHLHIPFGKGYRHVCSCCGNVVVVSSSPITL